MKRFLRIFALLIVSLLFLVSGVDAALDQFSHSARQNSLTVYNEQGAAVLAYNGDLTACKAFLKPAQVLAPTFLHRT